MAAGQARSTLVFVQSVCTFLVSLDVSSCLHVSLSLVAGHTKAARRFLERVCPVVYVVLIIISSKLASHHRRHERSCANQPAQTDQQVTEAQVRCLRQFHANLQPGRTHLCLLSRSAPHEDEPCPVLKRPSLLTRLADSGDQSQPVTKYTQPVHQLSTLAETAARTGNGQLPAASGRCPVCGDHMAADLLPAHVEQELSVLADEDAGSNVSTSDAQAAALTQPHRPGPLQPLQSLARRPNAMWKAESSHQPQHSKVLSNIGTMHARTCTTGLCFRA